MKVTLINTNDFKGGAGKTTYELFNSLTASGVDTKFVVKNKVCFEDENIIPADGVDLEDPFYEKLNCFYDIFINKNRSEISNTLFSFPYSNYPGMNLSNTPGIGSTDIIQLHWVENFLTIENIYELQRSGKPLVWSLHDMAPFTGGCHYSAGCNKYKDDCNDCIQLKEDSLGIPQKILARKKQLINQNITVVTQSHWMAQRAAESSLFGKSRIEVIHPGVNTNIFFPNNKEAAKKSLGINTDSIAILFGAQVIKEPRKGFSYLCEALRKIQGKAAVKGVELQLITFGIVDGKNREWKKIKLPILHLGNITEYNELVPKIYSAADIFVVSSLEDNFPRTMRESMACGTPVVAFNTGGMPDMVKPGFTGELAEPKNAEDLAAKIMKLAADDQYRRYLSENASQLVRTEFGWEQAVQKYKTLYRELIDMPGAHLSNQKNYQSQIDPNVFRLIKEHDMVSENCACRKNKDEQLRQIPASHAYQSGKILLSPLSFLLKAYRKIRGS